MKILTYSVSDKPELGIYVEDKIYSIEKICQSIVELKTFTKPKFFNTLDKDIQAIDVVRLGDRAFKELWGVEKYIKWQNSSGDPYILRNAVVDEAEIRWLPPIINPPLIFGVTGNSPLFFRDKDFQIPAYPRGFLRPNNSHALIGHLDKVIIPAHYETMRTAAELGVVIGKEGRYIKPEDAMEYVFGYTLVNDMCSDSWKTVALGDRQEKEMHEDLAVFTARATTSFYSRSTDTFGSVGPYIVTKDEVPDPYNLLIYSYMSGSQRDRSYTQSMTNGIEQTLAFLSQIFTLQPGMIIHMGTMGIDGFTVEKDTLLGPDDYFEIEYEGIGKLRNYICDMRKGSKK